ncbi:MAG TPA: FAD-dependent monooxygenase [Accumulibacter sp.]|uniref:FAD-dependent monooxygenase n=2 Tax=Accumulibacter sp. TaxID=2053492 RepID=UPI002C1A5AAB|nr:FAD-dependent monooxygenase [Accumulibacter sp.]HMW80289.1 FAD-dependent monooxygenase [Accumulibacter sp.]HNB66714.1 FAD-dependent monooxygenase [Accumulibacter sp.]HNH92971.1 FAD-dependent monooxygenase [Accumulibacter sp.]HNK03169.1 FAD-dependent monooxygenase [Accumulibacter sp.]HNN82953.1 FAD-dependent monooxygenase [Accumulibacter sp.]
MNEAIEIADIAVIGAGPVGMTLALALAGSPWRVRLIDSRSPTAWASDPRALALSHGTRQVLTGLDAWNDAAATPITTIHVSQRGGFGRTLIEASDYDIPALGYVMRYRELASRLASRLDAQSLLHDTLVVGLAVDAQTVTLRLGGANGERMLCARLVVHAEGTPGAASDVRVFDYRQHAVVAEVRPNAPPGGRAWERFTPDGPLALLPLGNDYSIVFTVPPGRAEHLQTLSDEDFIAALREQFGRRVDFLASGRRAAFPLALRVRRRLAGARQVWIGNAAQSLHPVSGQGFNLGLRDACELAAALGDSRDDPGSAQILDRYARRRWLDRSGSMAFTDGIVRAFSNDIAPLRAARGLGLLALDTLPALRHFVAKRMIWGARAWP